jgi:thiamine-monophosphate kinase
VTAVLSEFDIIARYFQRPPKTALLGVGDDCALVKAPEGVALAISTDMLVEGVHFFPDVDPSSLGHKALAVNLSDLAAMGAEPRWATLALALPAAEPRWLEGFSRALFELAGRHQLELIGGDTTRGPLNICITVIGLSPPGLALRRDGARAGDDIWLSGRTGEAALAVAAKRGTLQLPAAELASCEQRLHWPQPRVALGLALRGVASGAIDVSDGLVQDAGHLCERSVLAAEVQLDLLPVAPAVAAAGDAGQQAMLAGGDDYELCFTAATSRRGRIEDLARTLELPLTRIGRMVEGSPGVRVLDASGATLSLGRRGFDHFRP